ncbi:alpha/beta hydrolase [Ornithinimicrobium humiphilum]|uniref:Pimeloyl-ACP methyl ester carboxylesterase n=1 Tax=Ornithinimicrobium humiphilum TaxID=125288 RepID=A0A543KRH0_9MICO|nr:alpha/beta hydrolase [Ornithinimicrobium humiphilum]TQM97668.1 pimeloyl-ACP methyl ester carboxylesterase [Ornithinimicrobium humiphilum]
MADEHSLSIPGATLVYDVDGPLPPADGQPVLLMVGQPMDASGFRALADRFPDRTVVTYDPRGLGRSTRSDGEVTNSPTAQAEDLHALVQELGTGPVDVFASSGGAVTALALVAAHPQDVATLVAHEPPILGVLPDADLARRASAATTDVYEARGWGAGMASFLAMTMWQGEFTEDYLRAPAPDPAQFGLPTEDDGSRDDPLLGDRSTEVTDFVPDVEALRAAPTRIVLAVGEETGDTLTARTARATAALLGQEAVVFPSHHGGFGAEDGPWPGRPREFAERLREVLAGA